MGSSIISGQVMNTLKYLIDWKRTLGLGSSLATYKNKAFKDEDMSVKLGTSQVIIDLIIIAQKICR